MIKIAHRGNLNGPNLEFENLPHYISKSINLGFDCEIDFWVIDHKLFLGHDSPANEIKMSFLETHAHKLWIHCKNLEALDFVLERQEMLNGFWHENDDHTLTTKGFIWTFPNKPVNSKSIIVNLDYPLTKLPNTPIAGICSDYIARVV
jgi:hypothetical protein